ncbi:MAG TPA: hypothetical protein PK239_05620 [Chitinophagales bacterium]|nr:hypothetical protein [Chitinophagales bacterium]HRK26755.1 hypothetical protein [Chitinophagales bacterium]
MVVALFWLFLVIDILLTIVSLVGKGYRESYGASAINLWFPALVIGSTVGGILLRFVFRRALWALGVVALPLLVLLIWYLVDTKLIT